MTYIIIFCLRLFVLIVSYTIVQTNAHHDPIIKRHDHITKLIEYESPHVAILNKLLNPSLVVI